jgi:hypothetical protein
MELKARLPPLDELSRTCLSELLVSLAEVKWIEQSIDSDFRKVVSFA